MLTQLSYNQKVWAVGFNHDCVEMPSIMVPYHNMLKIHERTTDRRFVAYVVLMEAMFLCFNLKPDDCNLATTILLLKLSQLHKTLILGKLWLEFL